MGGVSLIVEFLDERRTVAAEDTLSFGRAADLVIDTNPALHRIVGLFFHAEDAWWLTNKGKTAPLNVNDLRSASALTIVPGATACLSFPTATISFQAGEANYRFEIALGISLPDPPMIAPPTIDRPIIDQAAIDPVTSGGIFTSPSASDHRHDDPLLFDTNGNRADLDLTEQPDAQPLTPEQLVLLTALAEPILRSGPTSELPTNRQVAHQLGWSITKFNRKLDAVCKKLDAGGVTGLVGTQDRLARDRRQRLVEYAIYARLVTERDLQLLELARSNATVEQSEHSTERRGSGSTI